MSDKREKGRPILMKKWILALLTFFLLQIILIICDSYGWSLNIRDIDGTIFDRISKASLFTKWFVPYNNSIFNVFAAFFTMILVPYAIVNAIKDVSHKRRTNNHTG
mgnify:CR=1 FL=1